MIARAMAKAPEERFATCREMIEAARAALGGRWQPRRAARSLPTSPPAPATSRTDAPGAADAAVGRDDELDAVLALLRQPAVRLVTLDRPRRHGQDAPRTRGRDEARRRTSTRPLFVDLAPVHDPKLVGSAIAEALGVPRDAGPAALGRDRGAARGRADAARARRLRARAPGRVAASSELLAAAPGLKVLGNEPDAASHPRRARVPGAAARRARAPATSPPTRRRCSSSRSARRRSKPSFELTDENRRRGRRDLPAARGNPARDRARRGARQAADARSRSSARLEEKRLSFLSGGGDQQGTLRDAIDWSYNLLDEQRQGPLRPPRRLRRRHVARDGRERRRPAARARVRRGARQHRRRSSTTASSARSRRSTASRASRCSRRSASSRSSGSSSAASSRTRATATSTRFVELAETAEPELTRANQAVWLERLTEENDNIRAALALVVRVGPGRARAAARRRARALLERARADDRGPPLAHRGARRVDRRRTRPCSPRRTSPPASPRSARATTRRPSPSFEREPRARPRGRRSARSRRRRSSRSAGSS